MTKLKAILAALGIGGILGAGTLWDLVISWLNLPPDFLNQPAPVKVLLVVAAVAGLIATVIKTSASNPDGTPATVAYRKPDEIQ
jgi:hypothetical protein